MSSAYFIVLEREIEGVDASMDGKGLGQNMQALDIAARSLGVKPLSEFYAADPDTIRKFLGGEGIDLGDINPPPLENFSAEEGLKTIRALLTKPLANHDGLVQDLRDCERILTAAAGHDVGWHFEIDF